MLLYRGTNLLLFSHNYEYLAAAPIITIVIIIIMMIIITTTNINSNTTTTTTKNNNNNNNTANNIYLYSTFHTRKAVLCNKINYIHRKCVIIFNIFIFI